MRKQEKKIRKTRKEITNVIYIMTKVLKEQSKFTLQSRESFFRL